MPWEPPTIETDPDAVTERILDRLAETIEGWEPIEGDPVTALAEEIGRETATTNTLAGEVIELAAAGFGETAFQFPAYLGATAWVPVDITVTAVGEVVPQGFTVVGINNAGVEVGFQLAEPVVATVSTTVPATMMATEVGNVGNTVPAGDLIVVTATSNVVDVAATSPSTGGADAENLIDYLDRLVDYLATLRPGGVRADDLAALARSVPGVERCLGVDLYDPANPGVESERTATVFPIDETGAPVNPAVAAQVQAVLEMSREVNFIIHVDQPTYTPVNVEYSAVADAGADPDVVRDLVDVAVLSWLAAWGSTPGDETAWEPVSVVRFLELVRVAGSVDGVAYLSSVTINGAAADFNLPGPAPLPASPVDPDTPSTSTGTVT